MPKKSVNAKQITNRRARYDYRVDDTLVVGMVLSGAETKALRLGHGQLQGAYVTIKDGDLYLVNAQITGSSGIHISEEEQTRTRKLLAKQREIDNLIAAKQSGKTIIPLEILLQGRFIKLRIASATGKKKYDKRSVLKARDEQRHIQNVLKSRRHE